MSLFFCAVALSYIAGCWLHWPAIGKGSAANDDRDHPIHCKPGPWGDLQYVPLYLEPPEDYLPVQAIENAPAEWTFKSYNADTLKSFLDSSGLSDAQKSQLLSSCKALPDGSGVTVLPSRDLILSMSEKDRKLIYTVLATFQANTAYRFRAFFPADNFDAYFANANVRPEIVKQLRQLSYQKGRVLLFCDAPLVLAELKTPAEKWTSCKPSTASRRCC